MPSLSLIESPNAFRWLYEPRQWSLDEALVLRTDPDTDYWQRTHYGFRRDNGHFFYAEVEGDFSATASVTFESTAQYDQCGLMCRVDGDTWMKCAVEYETAELSRLGSVVTNLGFSDWATQDIPTTTTSLRYKLDRQGSDFRLSWSEDGRDWRQMRIFHLHRCPPTLQVGICACSPTGPGFLCRASELAIGERDW